MNKQQVDNLLHHLGNQRRLFWYYPGQYAFWLLIDAMHSMSSIAQLRQLPVGRLLQQPQVRVLLKRCGNGQLHIDQLQQRWAEYCCQQQGVQAGFPLVLTLGWWGGTRDQDWYQTSRTGYNLVLRFDFAGSHQAELRQRFGDYGWLFNNDAHPVASAEDRRETLAWARLDVDYEHGEVLVEEIQSDWVRYARYAAQQGWRCDHGKIDPSAIQQYLNQVLEPYLNHWTEAVLTGTLEFIRQDLELSRVYYHSHQTGAALKGIRFGKPPKSLYYELPKKFCMTLTDEAPSMLKQDRRCRRVLKKIRPHRFYAYHLGPPG